MSALTAILDIDQRIFADSKYHARRISAAWRVLFNHLIGASQNSARKSHTELLGGF
jgi:hypothetical protein